MKLGLVARGEDRGLGGLTWAFHDHMQPDRTLLVDMGVHARGFASHPERFPGATVVDYGGGVLDESAARRWLDGLDVVYGAETWYDPRFPTWAAEEGVRTVLHAMPEFWSDQQADAVWVPTGWRAETIPAARVVPIPVATSALRPRPRDGSGGFLHVVGHRASADRAGTTTLMRALRLMRFGARVTVVTQDARLPVVRGAARVDLRLVAKSRLDRADLYELGDVLVAPRRYGGLSLPHNEAAGSGLGLVLADCPPNPDTWPCVPAPGGWRGTIRTPAGELPLFGVSHRELAAILDGLAREPERVADLSRRSLEWAESQSWERLRPVYAAAFEDVAA